MAIAVPGGILRLGQRRDEGGQGTPEGAELADAHLKTVLAVTHLLKEFALEAQELKTTQFRRALDRQVENMAAVSSAQGVEKAREKLLAEAEQFRETQLAYLTDRDEEFRKLVTLLTDAVEAMSTDNREFNRGLLSRFSQVEGIAELQDLRQMRQALSAHVSQLRTAVRDKDQSDSTHVSDLRQKVDKLESRLMEAEERAQKDPATGAYNRRALDAYLSTLIARNGFSRKPFCVAICDMDDLKTINDEFGHPIGDRAILALVETLREGVRKDDFVARYGGDEFVVVFPGLEPKQAERKGKSLLAALEKAVYYFERGGQRNRLNLRASLGMSIYRPGDTPQALVDRADEALYRAKRAGKGTVCVEP